MQIILMRHGQPAIDHRQWLSASGFGTWIERYNAAAIDPASPPPGKAIQLARQANYVLCSCLPRSLTSATALTIDKPHDQDLAFRELEMPHAEWRFPILPVSLWLVFFRICWALGYHRDTESFAAGRARASACADTLSQLSATHGCVLFIGHGLLNRFIARALHRAGWQTSEQTSSRHWEYATFSRPAIFSS